MTKNVRVENADTATYGVVVQVWDKGGVGENNTPLPDTLVREIELPFPTAMTEVGLTSTRYIVVKEKPAPTA